jgi:hypothetical protein
VQAEFVQFGAKVVEGAPPGVGNWHQASEQVERVKQCLAVAALGRVARIFKFIGCMLEVLRKVRRKSGTGSARRLEG